MRRSKSAGIRLSEQNAASEKPDWHRDGEWLKPKIDGKSEGVVPIEEGFERKNMCLAAVIDDWDFSLAQRTAATGGAVRLDGLKHIVFRDPRELQGKGGRPDEIPTRIGLVEADWAIVRMRMDRHRGKHQPVGVNGFNKAPQRRGHGVAEGTAELPNALNRGGKVAGLGDKPPPEKEQLAGAVIGLRFQMLMTGRV